MKRFFAFLFLTLSLLINAPQVQALSIIDPYQPQSSLFGENHSYSVVFRGNGEAIVSLKTIFTNTGSDNLNSFTLTLPENIKAERVEAFQVTREPQCIRYDTSSSLPIELDLSVRPIPDCLEYQTPDYYSGYYPNDKYEKITTELNGSNLTVNLPAAVEPEKSGSYFLYFRAQGYVNKNAFGVFDYNFETLKTNSPITNLQVGINTDSELYMSGAQQGVNYGFDLPAVVPSAGGAKEMAALGSYYQQIGYGAVNKTATNLDSGESFSVEGSYADSNLKLYTKQIAVGVGIFVVALLVIFVAIRVLARKRKVEGDASQASKKSNILIAGSFSFASAVGMTLYTFVLRYLATSISQNYYQGSEIVWLFLIVISFVIYTLIFLTGPIIIAAKRGLLWGLATAIVTLFWLVIIIGVVLVGMFFFPQIPPEVYPAVRAF